VIGVPRLTKIVDNDELVIIDGYEGTIVINPTPAMVQEYKSRVSRHEEAEEKLLENRTLAAITKDHQLISLQANIELVEELDDAIRYGAEGIGLYRSEFLYISTSPDLPTEEEHFNIYRKLAEATAPNWCVIRTFDLGGKKLAREVMGSKEDNPVLGLRALRLCMQHRDMFKTQLRALLRASAFGKIKIMFPLVSGVQELRQVKTLIREIRAPDGKVRYHHEPRVLRRVMDPDVAAQIRKMLVGVVTGGTSTEAAMLNFDVGGKSGTSRRTQGKHGYGAGAYTASFVSLFPAEAPQYVILVKLNNPKGDIFGGKTAAPVSKIVLQAALAASDASLDRGTLATSRDSLEPVADSTPRVAAAEDDDTVPPAVLDLGGARKAPAPVAAAPRPVPDVQGLSVRAAAFALHRAGFNVQLDGYGAARATAPAAGTLAQSGTLVRVSTTQ
jgi:hypothetical protein